MVKHSFLLSKRALVFCSSFVTIGQHVCDGFTTNVAFVDGLLSSTPSNLAFESSRKSNTRRNKRKIPGAGPLHAYAMDEEDYEVVQRNGGMNSLNNGMSTRGQDPNAAYVKNEIITITNDEMPQFVDLPMKKKYADIPEEGTLAAEAEMIIGRIAMVAAVAFFLGEFMTGESIAQQVTELL